MKIVREDLPRSERLASETPRSSAVRITGTLDTISASSGTILIVLPDGHRVQARLDTPDPELLRALFGKLVTISGMARFGLSGRLLIVDAEYLAPATPNDAIWERMPAASLGLASPVFRPMSQDPSSGVAAFFGIWPGEESTEELLLALDEIELIGALVQHSKKRSQLGERSL